MRCYRDCGNHRHDDITSAFRIDYAPLQIFEVIKPGLWCTGYRPRCHLRNRRNW